MMLDLNVDAASVDSDCDETDPKTTTTFPGDDSGASNASSSSVVNADDAPIITAAFVLADDESNSSSRTHHTTLKFSILNNVKTDGNIIQIKDDQDDDYGDDQEMMTRQLFPVARHEPFSLAATPQQWLNLSVPEGVGDGEMGFYNKAQQPVSQPHPQQPQQQVKKSRRGPRSRSSQYRGVTFYRRTGRWESHIWDSGKQVYLGGFDTAHAAARAYDQAAIKFRGVDADINFHISDYDEDMIQMTNLTKEEFVQTLRRQTTGFSRGTSKYRGVTLHKYGRWEARMGQLLGKKYIYLGLSDGEVEAARAYDKTAMKCNGREAVINFESSSYQGEITRATKDGGDNLDLNLWISPISEGPKETENSKNLHLHHAASELCDGKRLEVESFSIVPRDQAVTSKNSVIWTSMYSGLATKDGERMRKLRPDTIPLPGFTNWPWKIHHNGVIASLPLCSSAASSGFSSTATAYSTAFLSSSAQNKLAHSSDFLHDPMTLNYNYPN